MTDSMDFEGEEQDLSSHDNDDVFSNRDTSNYSSSKNNRSVPTWLMEAFVSWLARDRREIYMLQNLPLDRIAQLIYEFEHAMGEQYGFSPVDWKIGFQLV